jgi:hypothetical protein
VDESATGSVNFFWSRPGRVLQSPAMRALRRSREPSRLLWSAAVGTSVCLGGIALGAARLSAAVGGAAAGAAAYLLVRLYGVESTSRF